MKKPQGFITALGLSLLTLISMPLLAWGMVRHQAKENVYANAQETPAMDAALVLGAAAYGSRLSDALEDRVNTGIELYQEDKVAALVMSGAPNESKAMRNYALKKGVPPEKVTEHKEGLNTLSSVQSMQGKGQSVAIVSQAYHLPRALFIARQLEIKAVGVAADKREYEKIKAFRKRELISTVWAALYLLVLAE